MDLQSLIAVGLTPNQAAAYAALIEHGAMKPPKLATLLKTTRTNSYKLLDKLVELKLAEKIEEGKKLSYIPANPLSLANLTASYRAEAVSREEAATKIMHELLARYYEHSDKPKVEVVTGRVEVAAAYRKQVNLNEDIHFIHTKADIPMMGYDVMHEIRIAPSRHGKQRRGILVRPEDGPINMETHNRSNLAITWRSEEQYNAPVEWSVTKSSLLIVLYATEPHSIFIADPVVASAFIQLWNLLSSLLQQLPLHNKPIQAPTQSL